MSIRVVTVRNHFPRYMALLPEEVTQGTLRVVNIMKEDAYERTHVITGDMRDSLDIQMDSEGVSLGYGVPYAPDEELGNAYRPAHPALGPAVEAHMEELLDEQNQAFERAARKAGGTGL